MEFYGDAHMFCVVLQHDGAVAEGGSEPLGICAWALAVLSRARLAVKVTGRSELDGIARLAALPKFWAQPPALTGARNLVRASRLTRGGQITRRTKHGNRDLAAH